MRFQGRIMLAAALASLLTAAPAWATFPGANGKISFNRFSEPRTTKSAATCSASTPTARASSRSRTSALFTFSEFSDHSPDGRTLAFQRFDFDGDQRGRAPRRRCG